MKEKLNRRRGREGNGRERSTRVYSRSMTSNSDCFRNRLSAAICYRTELTAQSKIPGLYLGGEPGTKKGHRKFARNSWVLLVYTMTQFVQSTKVVYSSHAAAWLQFCLWHSMLTIPRYCLSSSPAGLQSLDRHSLGFSAIYLTVFATNCSHSPPVTLIAAVIHGVLLWAAPNSLPIHKRHQRLPPMWYRVSFALSCDHRL